MSKVKGPKNTKFPIPKAGRGNECPSLELGHWSLQIGYWSLVQWSVAALCFSNPVAADVSPLTYPAEKFEPTHVGCYVIEAVHGTQARRMSRCSP